MGQIRQTARDAQADVDRRLQEYFDRMQHPALDYDDIKVDFETLLHDPKAATESMRERLQALDRDSLVEVVSASRRFDHDQAEHLVSQFERARDELLDRLDQVKTQATEKVHAARQAVKHQAEEARKTAAAAAWWAFATAVISGGAAAAGGILAVVTGL